MFLKMLLAKESKRPLKPFLQNAHHAPEAFKDVKDQSQLALTAERTLTFNNPFESLPQANLLGSKQVDPASPNLIARPTGVIGLSR